jgi:hypothetical protein
MTRAISAGEAKQEKKELSAKERARVSEATSKDDRIPSEYDYNRRGLSGTPGTSASGRRQLTGNEQEQVHGPATQHDWSELRVHGSLEIGMASGAERNTHEGVGIVPEGNTHEGVGIVPEGNKHEGVGIVPEGNTHEGVGIVPEGTRKENVVNRTSVLQSEQEGLSRKRATATEKDSLTGQTEEPDRDGVVTENVSFAQALAIAKERATGHQSRTRHVHEHEGMELRATGPSVHRAQQEPGSAVIKQEATGNESNMPQAQERDAIKRSVAGDSPHTEQAAPGTAKRARLTAVDLNKGETQGRPSRMVTIIKGVKTTSLSPAVDDGGHEPSESQRPENARRLLFRERITRRGGTRKKEEPITIGNPTKRPRVRKGPKDRTRTRTANPPRRATTDREERRTRGARRRALAGQLENAARQAIQEGYWIEGRIYSHEELLRHGATLSVYGKVRARWLQGFRRRLRCQGTLLGTQPSPTGESEREQRPPCTVQPSLMPTVFRGYRPPCVRPRVRSSRTAGSVPTQDAPGKRVYMDGELHAVASMSDSPHITGAGGVGLSHRIGAIQEPRVPQPRVLSGSSGTDLRQPSLTTRDNGSRTNRGWRIPGRKSRAGGQTCTCCYRAGHSAGECRYRDYRWNEVEATGRAGHKSVRP